MKNFSDVVPKFHHHGPETKRLRIMNSVNSAICFSFSCGEGEKIDWTQSWTWASPPFQMWSFSSASLSKSFEISYINYSIHFNPSSSTSHEEFSFLCVFLSLCLPFLAFFCFAKLLTHCWAHTWGKIQFADWVIFKID